MKPRILINSDELEFFLLLNHILDVDGFTPILAENAAETVRLAVEENPHAIILDCRSTSGAAAGTCLEIKRDNKSNFIPMAALISPGAEKQHADLLKSGIDECFIRPFAPARLLDWLRSTLQVSPISVDRVSDTAERLIHSDIEMDLNSHRVYRNGREVNLGPLEFRLLRHLLEKPGQVFSRGELIGGAWPSNIFVEERTVDVHIGRLRKSLKAVGDTDAIRTVRSAGYALAVGAPD